MLALLPGLPTATLCPTDFTSLLKPVLLPPLSQLPHPAVEAALLSALAPVYSSVTALSGAQDWFFLL